MPSPFSGMDPWLESAREWPGFHDTLIIKAVEILQPQLRQRGYYAKPDARVWLGPVDREIGPDIVLARRSLHENAPVEQTATVLIADLPVRVARPEREFHEGFIEIYLAETHKLVTCIEFLSPTNKYEGDGRDLYQEKQQNLRAAGVHLVEIDLIRRGPHVLDVPLHVAEAMRPWEYLVNIVRRNAEDYEVYPLRLR